MVVFEGSFLNLLTIRTHALQMSFDEISRSLKHPRKYLEYLSQPVNRELKNENVVYLLNKIDDKDVVLQSPVCKSYLRARLCPANAATILRSELFLFETAHDDTSPASRISIDINIIRIIKSCQVRDQSYRPQMRPAK